MEDDVSILKKIKYNEPMKKHTSFKVGGNADLFISVCSFQELQQAIEYAKTKQIPFMIIGNGSNILVRDKGIRGLVIKIDILLLNIIEKDDFIEVSVGSGNKLMALAVSLKDKGISGLEELSGIPGTVGGAIYMNAGAYGKEMKDIVTSTKCIDTEGNIIELSNEQQQFEYRKSIFSKKNYIILETKLKLQKGDRQQIEEKMKDFFKQRKEKQPLEFPSAGSTFKRQEGVITAKLIDESGLKGYKIGDAMVSEKHAGFIINTGNATAKDIIELINYVKEKIYKNYGIKIEEEIKIIGETD